MIPIHGSLLEQCDSWGWDHGSHQCEAWIDVNPWLFKGGTFWAGNLLAVHIYIYIIYLIYISLLWVPAYLDKHGFLWINPGHICLFCYVVGTPLWHRRCPTRILPWWQSWHWPHRCPGDLSCFFGRMHCLVGKAHGTQRRFQPRRDETGVVHVHEFHNYTWWVCCILTYTTVERCN